MAGRFTYFRYNKVGKSSSEEEATTWFPRNEGSSPRKMIYKNECPDQLGIFEKCMVDTGNNLSECSSQNADLMTCATAAFKAINALDVPYNYAKGLGK